MIVVIDTNIWVMAISPRSLAFVVVFINKINDLAQLKIKTMVA